MYMTSAARIADTIAAGARKETGAASSIQEMNMSAFPRHTGAISGREKGCGNPEEVDMVMMTKLITIITIIAAKIMLTIITVKGTVTAYEGICCRE